MDPLEMDWNPSPCDAGAFSKGSLADLLPAQPPLISVGRTSWLTETRTSLGNLMHHQCCHRQEKTDCIFSKEGYLLGYLSCEISSYVALTSDPYVVAS